MRAVLLFMLAAGTLGCGGDDLLLPGDAAATRISIAAGDGQQGSVGATLADSISVLVSDATGRPVMGQPIAFAVADGEGARLLPDTTRTGAAGRAGARWILGRTVGTQRARAAIVGATPEGATVVFSASALPGSAAALARLSGEGQTAVVGSFLPDSLVVRAVDEFGNPVGGVQVSWAVSGGGSVSPSRVATSTGGRAAVRRRLGSQAGEQRATASVEGVNGASVIFSHAATGGGGNREGGDGGGGDGDGDGGGGGNSGGDLAVAVVSGDDQSAEAGSELPDPLVVRVSAGGGRAVAGVSVVWAITEGGGSVRPAFAVTDGSGRATTRWTLGDRPGWNRLTAAVSGAGTVEFEARGSRSRGGDDDDDDDDQDDDDDFGNDDDD